MWFHKRRGKPKVSKLAGFRKDRNNSRENVMNVNKQVSEGVQETSLEEYNRQTLFRFLIIYSTSNSILNKDLQSFFFLVAKG